ncbi:hypothetical protein AN189_02850 [Loktanella sp. 3ANDIMAR09]|uniref:phage tail protein n=1 Tax=Loktanella sp. 3ANDIMAR09 TaxID=1225657 RepID=UPI0006FBDCBF|nr:phage tail protein [Loktanella sp. 3ANDIMAR09]KQI69381.1 hypothetical protein AN189_02850 [Loktanella sp. 3ANDIMAR09]
MIAVFLGSIPLGITGLSGPVGHSISRKNTFAQYDVSRGKPVLHDIGAELNTENFDFFFAEEFCDPRVELARLEAAFALKTPLPLLFTTGGFRGLRYVVEALQVNVRKTDRAGRIVRVEASMALLEAPVPNLFDLLARIARGNAPAKAGAARINPDLKR